MVDARYPIRAAAKLTGLTADTIRAWEKRYGAIVPDRAKGGRLFLPHHIERLKLLKKAVDSGHAIREIARLADSELIALPLDPDGRPHDPPPAEYDAELERVFDSICRYDVLDAEIRLGKLAAMLPAERFVHDVSTPLIQRIGHAWANKEIGPAIEHLATALLRGVLSALMRPGSSRAREKTLLFATPPDELHELGILLAAMLTCARGFGVIYLGPNLPAREIIQACKIARPNAVMIGVLERCARRRETLRFFRETFRAISPVSRLLAGGRTPDVFRERLAMLGVPFFDSLVEFELFLDEQNSIL